MGGRGASSGISVGGNQYGTQYRTLLQSGNIKFVEKNGRAAETLMETMTKGRVYVVVGGGENLQKIVYFDNDNKRKKTVELDHTHKGLKEHTQHGYFHNEIDIQNGVKKGATNLTAEERKMLDRVRKLWYNHKHK